MNSIELVRALAHQTHIFNEWFTSLRGEYTDIDDLISLKEVLQRLSVGGLCIVDSGYAYRDEVAAIHLAACYLTDGETKIITSIPKGDYFLRPLSIYKRLYVKPGSPIIHLSQPWIEPMPIIAELAFMYKLVNYIQEKFRTEGKYWIIARHGPLIQQLPQYERQTYFLKKEQLTCILKVSAWDDEEVDDLFEKLEPYEDNGENYTSSRVLLMLLHELCERCEENRVIPIGYIENPSRSGFLLRYLIGIILSNLWEKYLQNRDLDELNEDILKNCLDYTIGGRPDIKSKLVESLVRFLLGRGERQGREQNKLTKLKSPGFRFRLATDFKNEFMSRPRKVFDMDFFRISAAENTKDFKAGDYLIKAVPRISIDESYFSEDTKRLIEEKDLGKIGNAQGAYEPMRTYCFVDRLLSEAEAPNLWNIGLKIRQPLALEMPRGWFEEERLRVDSIALLFWSSRMNKLGLLPAMLTADAYAKMTCSDYKKLEIAERIMKKRWVHLYYRSIT